MAERFIASGAWVQVKVFHEGEWKPLGLASGASYNEDFGIQPANVINHLGPISYDSHNYSCQIQLSSFVPNRKQLLNTLPDQGEITIADLLPTRDEIQQTGKGKEFEGLAFVNTSTNEIINQFYRAIVSSNGRQVNPNNYLTADIQFMSVKRTK